MYRFALVFDDEILVRTPPENKINVCRSSVNPERLRENKIDVLNRKFHC